MKRNLSGMLSLLLAAAAVAQDVPLQRPEELRATRQQSQQIYDAIRPLNREIAASTVWIWADRRQVALGTVVGGGDQVLTKWSEIAFSRTPVQVVGGDGRTATATVLGIYQDEDVALLQLDGERFTPVDWSQDEVPALGRFLVAASPDPDQPLRVGVVSVATRTLRDSDQAFIGIILEQTYEGEGVQVGEVSPESGAANAGIRPGDVILRVAEKPVASPFELRNALLDYSPGDEVEITLRRDGGSRGVGVLLGGRPKFPGVPEGRLRTMRRMGGPISLVGQGFPLAIQTDMKLKPNLCGGPVVDLQGRVVGITIARTDRTRSFVLPAAHIEAMLTQDPVDPTLAQLPREMAGPRDQAAPQAVPMNPRAAGRLQRRLEEMSRFLERLDREMGGIGE